MERIKIKNHSKEKLTLCTRDNKNSGENINRNNMTYDNNVNIDEFYSSDSSIELIDVYKSKTTHLNSKNDLDNTNFIEYIDLTNNATLNLKNNDSYAKFDIFNIKKNSSIQDLTVNSSNSEESFKSASSSNLEKKSDYIASVKYPIVSEKENNLIDTENNFSTPNKLAIQLDRLSESAKVLDRLYGRQWRKIDGIFNIPKKDIKKKLFENDDENSSESIIDSKSECESCYINYKEKGKANLTPTKNIQKELDLTSESFMNISLSDARIDFNFSNKQDDVIPLSSTLNKSGSLIFPKKNKTQEICLLSKPLPKKELKNVKSENSDSMLSFLSSLSCYNGSLKCHPEAEKYKFKFKKNKDDLVSALFDLFNKEVFENKLPDDMNFKWNARLRTTAGACFNRRSVKINENLDCVRISRIELSSKIIDTAERLRDTLIHELCHAACWIFNGVSEGHGPAWKSWANKAMKRFPELPIIKRCHSYAIQTKYTYKCMKCGYSIGRHSKSLNLEKKRCGYCYGEFELIVNKMNKNPTVNINLQGLQTDPLKELYKIDDKPQTNKLPRKPSKFAIFVKENYGKAKRENPLLKHGEIMKILGSQFSVAKTLTPDDIFDRLLDS
ncbi:uncharacterized protein LOC126905399 [Daktulosphaira vitifoliae]|uniref:uncharacterized protein LOC126905399 n=1 Tax=Daktulosphaira vitifoliae TaxID=58002 RepID=UPI0021AACEE8|nr:uncharacterized protein LOC126905399 [Daktulosphaira vitifoliae]